MSNSREEGGATVAFAYSWAFPLAGNHIAYKNKITAMIPYQTLAI